MEIAGSIISSPIAEYKLNTRSEKPKVVDTQLIHAKALDFENRFPSLSSIDTMIREIVLNQILEYERKINQLIHQT